MGILTALFSPIADIVGGYIKRKQQLAQAKADHKAALIQSKTDNDHAWEMAEINASDKWIRRACFAQFSFVFYWAAFDPAAVHEYFTVALSAVPAWYIKAYLVIIGSIWGVVELKNAIPSMIRPKGGNDASSSGT